MANKTQLASAKNTGHVIDISEQSGSLGLETSTQLNELYQRHESLHVMLQDVINVEMVIENTMPCVAGIYDLLSEIKTFLNKEYSLQDDASWPVFLDALNNFQKQINFYVQQAQFGESNLLLGEGLSLEIKTEHIEVHDIRGEDLSALGLDLNYIEEEFTSHQTALYSFYKKLDPAAAKVRSYNTYLRGVHTIVKNQRRFTERRQTTLQNRIDMKRRKNIKLLERIRSVQSSIMKMKQQKSTIQRLDHDSSEGSLEMALKNALINYNLEEDKVLPPDNVLPSPGPVDNFSNYQIGQDIVTAELFAKYDITGRQDNENEVVEPVLIEQDKKEEEISSEEDYVPEPTTPSSFFRMILGGEKEDTQDSIRPILNRLKHSEDLMDLDCLIENTHTLNLNQLCAEILRYIDHSVYLSLITQYEDKTDAVYVEHLQVCIADKLQDAGYLFTTDVDFRLLFENYESAFQEFVKQQRDNNQSPEMIEAYVRKWLASPYGEIYKVIFSVLRGNNDIH